MPIRALVVQKPGENHMVGRTLRALAAAGVVADVAGLDLAKNLGAISEPIWLVGAGAWPIHPGPIARPAPSATGRPLVAFGSVHDQHGVSSGRPASLFLDVAPAQELGRRLSEIADFDEAARELLASDRWRIVRFSALDVHDDPGLRVVQVVTSLQRGGAERLTLDLTRQLGRQGVSCRLVVIGWPTRQAFPSPSGTVDLAPLALDRAGRADAVGKVGRSFAADIVHGHLIDGQDIALFAAQKVPLVLTIHNQRPGWPQGLEAIEAGQVILLVACARAVGSDLTAAGLPAPVRVAWNGIDAEALAPTPSRQAGGDAFRRRHRFGPRDFVLLVLANPRPQKRLDRLPGVLAATRAELARRGVLREARLIIAGEASPSSQGAVQLVKSVQTQVQELGLTRHVRWAGPVSDVATALAAADVLISTSEYEGLSLAQLEALAAGVPVVATDAGGVGELVPGDAAVTVLPRDIEPRRFAAALADRAMNPTTASLPDHFTVGTMAARYRWLYTRALSAARRRRPGDGLFLVTNNLSLGGAQSSARRLLVGLAGQQVRVRAAVLEEDPDHATPGRRALLAAGIPVLALTPAGSIGAAEAVARLLDHVDSDPPAAVLLWNVIPEYRVLIADGLMNVPLYDVSPGVMSFDALDRYFARPRVGLPYRNAAEYGARLSGAIVKYRGEADRASKMLQCAVHVIPNGVPIDTAPRPVTDGTLVIGTAARINPHKRLDLLLDATRRAHSALPQYVLRVAGGVERNCDTHAALLRERASGLPVEWLGGLDDVSGFLRGLDLFVLIAEPAGCPNASLEAMAAGLPVIATNAGGMCEQVDDGVTGRLVGRADVDGLAAAMVEAAGDHERRLAWGSAGQKRIAEQFSLERMIAGYRRVCLEWAGDA